ncbi:MULTISPECIES: hypothetical protein [Thalassospira]|jgi:hypothetical protein|uniref:Major tropism determinant N-terminal domain-containing protein n=1 Tax=Thalassospira xiamenensis TaxID=220697 RepID=A0ABR5Y5F6_9PROT|nr:MULTISPECIES: hypothetical protein [Thalassospira]MAL30970.1 hypothetical protein [Thalassospira sp.]MBR9779378.1 hypothetical protein [Rhodospirillales bacterium]KZD05159.1 hypothetical protein AUP40_14150 [Thalassospira xiamenensis]KZD11855.1 hypothetical protein AUP45_01655 [Thalassospira xiamenensis]MBL4843191.1 hypothetical protein [Thalassospira sp.]|tara:strand:+ start:8047 stop:8754 length:708 start_codon:yes stop_codon:yes gene_type:complete
MADSSFFQSYKGSVQPGDLFTIHRRGRSVAMVAASDDLEIVINDGSRSRFFAGASLSFDVEFEKIQIFNPNATAATFELWTAMGRVDDNRLTASGDLNVIDPNTGDSFANVIAKNAEILAMMQSDTDQGHPVKVLGENAATAGFIASSVEIISPLLNTNGVIVRHASILTAASYAAGLFYGASAPGSMVSNHALIRSSNAVPVHDGQFLLSAGLGLWALSTVVNGYYTVSWDYLP